MKTLSPEGYKVQAIVAEAFPEITICKMEMGDYFSGKKVSNNTVPSPKYDEWCLRNRKPIDHLIGNLVEIKIGNDFGIHTEQLERFQDECCRMSNYRVKNPHVCLHAYWLFDAGTTTDKEIRHFAHICY